MTILRHHYVFAVPDAAATAGWFVDVLGFEAVDAGDEGWRFVRRDGVVVMLGSCPGSPRAEELGNHSYVAYWVVDDVDAFHAEIVARGATPFTTPADQPWGMREFGLHTPDGHRIMVGSEMVGPSG